jgi:hypothetical protein
MEKFMRDSGNVMKHMDRELIFMKMEQHILVHGNMIYNMVKVVRNGLMEGNNNMIIVCLKVHTNMVKKKD